MAFLQLENLIPLNLYVLNLLLIKNNFFKLISHSSEYWIIVSLKLFCKLENDIDLFGKFKVLFIVYVPGNNTIVPLLGTLVIAYSNDL